MVFCGFGFGLGGWGVAFFLVCFFVCLFFKQFSLLWILVVQSLSCANGKEISKSTECRTKLQLSSNNDFESVCSCLVVYWTLTVYFGPYKQHEDGWLLRTSHFKWFKADVSAQGTGSWQLIHLMWQMNWNLHNASVCNYRKYKCLRDVNLKF